MPKKWYAALVLAGFFCGANYVAWQNAFLSMKGREVDLHHAELKAISIETQNARLQGKLDEVTQRQTVEPAASLRRRTKKLADGIDQFLDQREANHPSRNDANAGVTEERLAEIQKAAKAYDMETENICVARFGGQIQGIPKELAARGLPVDYLDKFTVRCLMGGNRHGSETEWLRGLAFRLDSHDNPIQF
jgi:hypothetical protein